MFLKLNLISIDCYLSVIGFLFKSFIWFVLSYFSLLFVIFFWLKGLSLIQVISLFLPPLSLLVFLFSYSLFL